MGANLGLNQKACEEAIGACTIASKQLTDNHSEITSLMKKLAQESGSNFMNNCVTELTGTLNNKVEEASTGLKNIAKSIEEIVEEVKRIDE